MIFKNVTEISNNSEKRFFIEQVEVFTRLIEVFCEKNSLALLAGTCEPPKALYHFARAAFWACDEFCSCAESFGAAASWACEEFCSWLKIGASEKSARAAAVKIVFFIPLIPRPCIESALGRLAKIRRGPFCKSPSVPKPRTKLFPKFQSQCTCSLPKVLEGAAPSF